MIVIANRRKEIIAAIGAAIGKIVIARQLEPNALQGHVGSLLSR
jgi:hypothetical protein